MFGIDDLLVGAAVVGLAGGLTNYALGSSAARDAVDESVSGSQTLSRWNALELPRLQMAGLEKAGLNPILTAGNLGSAAAQVQAPINPNSSAIGDAISGLPNQLMSLSQGMANLGQTKANTMATQANVQMGQQRLAIESARAQADVAKVEQEKLESAARTMQMLAKDEKGEHWFVRLNKARDELLRQQAEAAKSTARRNNRNVTLKLGPFGNFSFDAMHPIDSAWKAMMDSNISLSGDGDTRNDHSAKAQEARKKNPIFPLPGPHNVKPSRSQRTKYLMDSMRGWSPSDGGLF